MNCLTRFLLLAWLCLAAWPVFSQDYHVFSPDRAARYLPDNAVRSFNSWDDSQHYVMGIRWTQSDTVATGLLLSTTGRIIPHDLNPGGMPNCLVLGDSWIGPQVLLGNGDYDYHFNRNGDTIAIHRHAALGDSWPMYVLDTNTTLQATVVAHSDSTFLTVTDSVKTIELAAVDGNGAAVAHALTGQRLLLSKEHGWLQTFNFRDFPGFDGSFELQPHSLAGQTNPAIGLQQLTVGDVYNFEVGDKFHLKRYEGNIGCTGDTCYWRVNHEITGKQQLTPTSVQYIRTEYRWWKAVSQAWPVIDYVYSYHFVTDTFVVENTDQPFVSEFLLQYSTIVPDPALMPLEVDTTPLNSGTIHAQFVEPDLYNGRAIEEPSELTPSFSNGCYNEYSLNALESSQGIAGCGLYRVLYSVGGGTRCSPCESLVYFEKGNETWGNPLVPPAPLTAGKSQLIPEMQVFPNPATGHIRVQLPANSAGVLELYSMAGRLVHVQPAANPEIQLEGIPAGVYFLKYQSKTSQQVARVVVQTLARQ